MHTFKRQRSASAESVSSSTSNKRSGSSPAGIHHLGAMDLNESNTPSGSATSSSSTEPLVSEDGIHAANTAIAARLTPPAGRTQLEQVLPQTKKALQAGDTWFVIDRKWYRKWQAACGDAQEAGKEEDLQDLSINDIGPIDNSAIADQSGKLTTRVTEGQDAIFVPGEAWIFLEAWYGTTGAPVKAEVIDTRDGPFLDLFPPRFTLSRVVSSNSSVPSAAASSLQASSGWTIGHLKGKIAETLLGRPVAKARLWHVPFHDASIITPEKMTTATVDTVADDEIIRTSTFTDGEHIALEEAADDGSWLVSHSEPSVSSTSTTTTRQPLFGGPSFVDQKENAAKRRIPLNNVSNTPSSANSAISSTAMLTAANLRQTRSQTGASSTKQGLVGLTNLGNTCFMNSALQCLSNTPSLQHYFHSGYYKEELNPDNPLGMNGEVAKAFGTLIQRIWSGGNSTVTPREFKQTLSKFAPAFSGWQQHDSQELIAFLLDGLHEDLNRIKKKPYDEIPDWNGGGDKEEMELANISWDLYKRRNDSVIVDLFQGQYRSRLICPECNKVAIKFDPFMYLSLAIPQNKKWVGSVYVVPADPKKMHIKATLELPANSSLKKLKQAVGELTGYDHKKLFTTEEWGHRFYKVWTDSELVSDIGNDDIIIMHELPYEITQPRYRSPKEKSPEQEGKIVVTVVSVRSGAKEAYSSKDKLFGEPFILALTEEEASGPNVIQEKICERLASWKGVGDKIWNSQANGAENGELGSKVAKASRLVVSDDEEEGDTDMQDASGTSTTLRHHRSPNPQHSAITVSKFPSTYQPFTETGGVDRISLQERAQRVHAAATQKSAEAPHIPGSFGIDDTEDLYGEEISTHGQTGPTEMVTESAPKTPILKFGETVVVDWNADFVAEAFGTDADIKRTSAPERFSAQERITDPIVAQRQRFGENKKGKKAVTVDDLLDEFVKEEKLSEDNTWYCPSCKKHQEAQKKFDLWKMPDVLVIHLKRFSNERAFRDKIDTLVDFPIEGLDLSDRVEGKKAARRLVASGAEEALCREAGGEESLIYDLFAVDNHFGGLGGGHYTAFAKNINDGKWYNFDDSRVSPVSNPDDVRTSSAYLLFYRRRTDKPIGGKTHEILASQTASPALSVVEDDGADSLSASRGSMTSPYFTSSPAYANLSDRFRQTHGYGSKLSHPSASELDLEDDNFSTAPSPADSDNNGDFASSSPHINLFNRSANSSSSHLGFGEYSNDSIMDTSRSSAATSIEIKIDPSDVARAAEGVSMDGDSTSMDEVE